jgi:hypothetical protein
MTSAEIKQTQPTDLSTNGWLKVVALQLSILIESLSAQEPEEIAQSPEPIKRGPGRPRKS